MTRYPNSECEKHSNVVVTEPVCLICLMDAIELLTQTNKRQAAEIERLRGEVFRMREKYDWQTQQKLYKIKEIERLRGVMDKALSFEVAKDGLWHESQVLHAIQMLLRETLKGSV